MNVIKKITAVFALLVFVLVMGTSYFLTKVIYGIDITATPEGWDD